MIRPSFKKRYHRFFPTPAPEKLFYHTRQKITANIDDTPEKETIVTIVVDSGILGAFEGYWAHAFLLILDETETDIVKKKAFFKLYDAGIHDSEVPAAISIEHHSPEFVFKKPRPSAAKGRGIGCKPIDLTGDGLLDLWLDLGRAVARDFVSERCRSAAIRIPRGSLMNTLKWIMAASSK